MDHLETELVDMILDNQAVQILRQLIAITTIIAIMLVVVKTHMNINIKKKIFERAFDDNAGI